jgi:hypothetical protein
MAREDFVRTGTASTQQTYAVAASGPYAVNDSTGKFLYWVPGTVNILSNNSSNPVSLMSGFRQTNKTPGFTSPKRLNLPLSLSFDYSKSSFASSAFLLKNTNVTSVSGNGPGTSAYEYSKTFEQNRGGLPEVPDDSATWTSKLVEKATSNLLNNIKGSSFNAAQAIAERKQTADLVASTATRIAKSYSNLRKGNFAKAAQDLGIIPPKRAGKRFNKLYPVDQGKAVGNAWLELNYGWKPLLADVYGSMETLARANNPANGFKNGNMIYQKSKGRAHRKESPTIRTKLNISPNIGVNETIATATIEVSVKMGVTYAVSSPPIQASASLGISNPALLAWELLPYSFVADWFLPIGNYLGQLDATNGLSFYDGYITIMTKYTGGTVKFTSYRDPSGIFTTYGTGEQSRNKFTLTRRRLASFPQAPFPRFKNPLSSSHVASAMSLLLQTFKR